MLSPLCRSTGFPRREVARHIRLPVENGMVQRDSALACSMGHDKHTIWVLGSSGAAMGTRLSRKARLRHAHLRALALGARGAGRAR
jgi:hypothetical protein